MPWKLHLIPKHKICAIPHQHWCVRSPAPHHPFLMTHIKHMVCVVDCAYGRCRGNRSKPLESHILLAALTVNYIQTCHLCTKKYRPTVLDMHPLVLCLSRFVQGSVVVHLHKKRCLLPLPHIQGTGPMPKLLELVNGIFIIMF